jgi:predicted TIM-barrel fold metal-dependent hydrolase
MFAVRIKLRPRSFSLRCLIGVKWWIFGALAVGCGSGEPAPDPQPEALAGASNIASEAPRDEGLAGSRDDVDVQSPGGAGGTLGKPNAVSDAGSSDPNPASEQGGAGGTAVADDMRVIDTHTHFWDLERDPPPGRDKPVPFHHGESALPGQYAALAEDAGVHGTVLVEASDWLEDNLWALELAEQNPVIVGVIGNLSAVMGTPDFVPALTDLSERPLFRGIRVSPDDLENPQRATNLRTLAERGLAVDVNAPGAQSALRVANAAKAFPELSIVLDHAGYIPFDRPPSAEWLSTMAELAPVTNVFCKVSRIQEQTTARPAPDDVATYRATLDLLWETFGADRLLFGSNWPLSEEAGSLDAAVEVTRQYFAERGAEARNKFFSGNARRVYQWVER